MEILAVTGAMDLGHWLERPGCRRAFTVHSDCPERIRRAVVPGASAWADEQGNFWLFGGVGLDSVSTLADLNDLWEFKP